MSSTYQLSPNLLTTAEVAQFLNISVSTLNNARVSGRAGYPPYHKIGGSVRYRLSDLEAYLQACLRTNTSEDGGKNG